jgi:hypothetical protein
VGYRHLAVPPFRLTRYVQRLTKRFCAVGREWMWEWEREWEGEGEGACCGYKCSDHGFVDRQNKNKSLQRGYIQTLKY